MMGPHNLVVCRLCVRIGANRLIGEYPRQISFFSR